MGIVKWSSRNEGFEDKKRTGRQKFLNEASKKILTKACEGEFAEAALKTISKQRNCSREKHGLGVHEKRRLKAKETSAHCHARWNWLEIC